ncbi:MAG TPA: class I SAM-dependent methyltransferase [Steroidobacteraceae bacterium]|jgi:hypothetical protein|nr:class I SAM-dependent methyltransferase [Steroidobacteraceae bacterium]
MRFVKSLARKVLPTSAVAAYRDHKLRILNERNQRKKTCEAIFTDIYARNLWGGQHGTFWSGSGSHNERVTKPYVQRIVSELERLGAQSMTAIDLGCGDYSIGQQLAPSCGQYIGVDIVQSLIAHNQATFGSPRVHFLHANIVEDPLPVGDICFLRQVLQHLSNEQIAAVLPKLEKFRVCFITEHHPSPSKLQVPNKDKPHGSDVRVYRGSGVFLDKPPFNVDSSRVTLLLEVAGTEPMNGDPGVIRTYLLAND